jgi:hypothetical protein
MFSVRLSSPRRFGTLCQVHLQRLDEEYVMVRGERGIYIYRVRVSSRHGIYKYHALLSPFIFFIKPLKMDLTEGS